MRFLDTAGHKKWFIAVRLACQPVADLPGILSIFVLFVFETGRTESGLLAACLRSDGRVEVSPFAARLAGLYRAVFGFKLFSNRSDHRHLVVLKTKHLIPRNFTGIDLFVVKHFADRTGPVTGFFEPLRQRDSVRANSADVRLVIEDTTRLRIQTVQE